MRMGSKRIKIILVAAFIFGATEIDSGDILICDMCLKNGLKSVVFVVNRISFAIGCPEGHYNEEGNWVDPMPCGGGETTYRCSNGHAFKVRSIGGNTETIYHSREAHHD